MSTNKVETLITDNLDIWTGTIKKRGSQGRGSNKKIELYGIKKLRELILDLAVRGLLVPQDPNDEPASVLLEKIAVEKERLMEEGTIKKRKPFPEIEENERTFELPTGWAISRLGDVMNVLNGRAYKKHEMLQEGTPLLRVGNLFTSKEWYYSDIELEPEKYINKGDLIYAWSASFGPFIWDGGKVIYHYHIWKLDLFHTASLDKLYLLNYLQSITASIKASGNGIAMIHMTKERMEKLILPIAPLAEQHRIVAKVNELMALCDQLEQQTENSIAHHQTLVETLLDALTDTLATRDDNGADFLTAMDGGNSGIAGANSFQQAWQRIADNFDVLFTTEQSVEKLKQTILQLAVMGKLVPQNPNDEPASVLLEKIAAEKAQLIKDGKIKKQKALPPIGEHEKPFELPVGWVWTQLGEISEIAPRNALDDDLEVGFVPMPMITTSYKGDHEQEVKAWSEIKKGYTHFANGDIGLAKITPCFENSKASVFKDLKNGYGAGTTELHIARPIPATLDPLFILLYLKAPMFLEKGKTKMTGSAGQKRIPNSFFSGNPLPFAPLAEQHRIVTKVNELMTLCDQLKTQLSEAQTIQLHLTDAIAEGILT